MAVSMSVPMLIPALANLQEVNQELDVHFIPDSPDCKSVQAVPFCRLVLEVRYWCASKDSCEEGIETVDHHHDKHCVAASPKPLLWEDPEVLE